jgi:amino acid transporter
MIRARLPHFWAFVALFAIALGIMLSPENLVILGQQSGASQRAAFLWLASAAVIQVLTARTYGAGLPLLAQSQKGTQYPKASGPPLAEALLLAARGGFALWGITAVLVTAGYVFNETFVPAYPNLGFSFTLLAILLLLNLLGPQVAAISQVIFAGAALTGLSALIVMGLWGSPETLLQFQAGGVTWKQSLALSPNFLLLFIGYELTGVLWKKTDNQAGHPVVPMLAGIIAAFCLFFLWGFLSLSYVPSLKLQESTVPYAYVARAIAGATGRKIMGVVLLAGTLAAANALMMTVPRLILRWPPAGLLPVRLRGRLFTLLLLSGGIALVMALGLGGSPNLALYLKASALIWLLTYARQHLIILREPQPTRPETPPVAILCALALTGAVVLALVTDPERATLGTYLLLVVGALTLIGLIPYAGRKQETENRQAKPV